MAWMWSVVVLATHCLSVRGRAMWQPLSSPPAEVTQASPCTSGTCLSSFCSFFYPPHEAHCAPQPLFLFPVCEDARRSFLFLLFPFLLSLDFFSGKAKRHSCREMRREQQQLPSPFSALSVPVLLHTLRLPPFISEACLEHLPLLTCLIRFSVAVDLIHTAMGKLQRKLQPPCLIPDESEEGSLSRTSRSENEGGPAWGLTIAL
ncbi:hypothetical protein BS78_K035900 [Paspalum vaginatum]|uniref:Secreted protein n=1 Tax=Paspalum vaginatum TaxID=158149 RepID=A0A9W7XD18_9POAL|nr:hypothetical protein BS78_K035900 [Paspalum vaginatum]